MRLFTDLLGEFVGERLDITPTYYEDVIYEIPQISWIP